MNSGKIIGVGYTASVYEWEGNKVLKLFNTGYPNESAESEYHNAMAIRDMNFSKPKAYEMISYKEQNGIIYDRVEGESLLDWVMKTGDLQECAICMAKLHKSILQNEISNVPNYKDFLRYHIPNTLLSLEEQKEILQMIDKLSDGNTLCHGDYHVGNILIGGGQPYVIDFMNICHGNYLYDVARTVFLTEYTPVPPETKDRDMILHFKKTLSDLYLMQMNVTREMIKDYLSVIIAVRKGECPNE
ncbi:aminoglycoside phosphotransferase family protein [Anaerocolumna xylanovorans]|uniref:TIGR02172 family protein n=1 Tax=Anaerocolumna xylanovorans DSM 12503 TaxID=1121345 RepID=A0A1M7YKT6_9FIRM|nr:aminoglycoside phosphotransferase family protein [Anaerocolumna xylanovorans]SHO53188.1 TIGR02172 family protein [Anaerocolumna xylanovorans DSM 12503]